MKRATIMLMAYIRALQINNFAIPCETAKGVEFCIIAPDTLMNCVEHDAPTIERRNGEMFARVKRLYTATKVLPYYRPIARIETPYKSVKEFPIHANMKARGAEIVLCNALNAIGDNAIHTGDSIGKCDVVSELFGNIEVKIGAGKLYYAGEKPKKRKRVKK